MTHRCFLCLIFISNRLLDWSKLINGCLYDHDSFLSLNVGYIFNNSKLTFLLSCMVVCSFMFYDSMLVSDNPRSSFDRTFLADGIRENQRLLSMIHEHVYLYDISQTKIMLIKNDTPSHRMQCLCSLDHTSTTPIVHLYTATPCAYLRCCPRAIARATIRPQRRSYTSTPRRLAHIFNDERDAY